jgi:glycosyltransferase involved in cell wall biosynthesis
MAAEVSVVMPCLNEEKSIGICIEKCKKVFKEKGISGEVVVSDNGSTDRSIDIAKSLGARVVHQPVKGYGSAYIKGIESAEGKYIVMGDSDDTYEFLEIERFIEPLRQGYDFVIGSRFTGKILPGAMPWANRYIGNPILSGMLRLFFHTDISDSHCGIRGFTKEAYTRMDLKTTGMEFASEMVMRAIKTKLKITEIPITYHPRVGESKLNSFQDAWRHIRFMLLYSPSYLYLVPGLLLLGLGLLTQVLVLFGILKIHGYSLDTHFMVLASMVAILGFQITAVGMYAKTYFFVEGFESDTRLPLPLTFYKYFKLEQGLIAGSLIFAAGFLIDLYIFIKWVMRDFGPITESKLALLALTFIVIGIQTIFSSFFLSMLGIQKRR